MSVRSGARPSRMQGQVQGGPARSPTQHRLPQTRQPGKRPRLQKVNPHAASVGVSDSSNPSLTASAWMCLPIRQRARVEARESTATTELECEGPPAVR